jgi:hypothetical protein
MMKKLSHLVYAVVLLHLIAIIRGNYHNAKKSSSLRLVIDLLGVEECLWGEAEGKQ